MARPSPSSPAGRAGTIAIVLLLAVVVGGLLITRTGGTPRAGSGAPGAAPSAPASSTDPGSTTPTGPSPTAPAEPPLVSEGTVCVPATTSATLRVITFNIKSAGFGGRSRLAEIAAHLVAWKPDVVLLEEVDNNRPLSGRVDQAAYLADALGFEHAFGLNVLRPGNSQYGTAILSRYPILAQDNTPLPNRPGLQQRGLLRASVEIEGQPVNLYVTHLQNTSRSMRVDQLAAVRAIVAADPAPKILGGDLNDTPGSPVLAQVGGVLADAWSSVGSGPGLTAPAGSPRARIDYLLYSSGSDPATTVEPLSAAVLPASGSDHRPMTADFRLTTTGPPVCVPQL